MRGQRFSALVARNIIPKCHGKLFKIMKLSYSGRQSFKVIRHELSIRIKRKDFQSGEPGNFICKNRKACGSLGALIIKMKRDKVRKYIRQACKVSSVVYSNRDIRFWIDRLF